MPSVLIDIGAVSRYRSRAKHFLRSPIKGMRRHITGVVRALFPRELCTMAGWRKAVDDVSLSEINTISSRSRLRTRSDVVLALVLCFSVVKP